jgi:hypothetical protein
MEGIINNRSARRKHDLRAAGAGGLFAQRARAILLCLFFVHLASTFFFISPADIINERPIVTLDHSFHYYQAWRAKRVLISTGELTAYDPYFMAGFPSAIFDLDVKGAEVFCSIFPEGQLARGLKLFILICYLSMVFTVYTGARLLGFRTQESLFAVGALLVFWHWGRPFASHFRYAGMFEFIFVSHLSILVAGLFRRFMRTGERLWFFVIGPLVFLVHPTAVVALAVPFVVILLAERRRLTSKKVIALAMWCGIVVVVNAVWILPMLANITAKASSKAFFQTRGIGDLVCVFYRPGCIPAAALLVLAGFGAWRLVRLHRNAGATVLGPAVLFLLLVSSYGIYIPGLEHLEPGRFLLTALFFAMPLAGAGAAAIMEVGRHAVRSDFRSALRHSAREDMSQERHAACQSTGQVRVASAGPPERRSGASTRGLTAEEADAFELNKPHVASLREADDKTLAKRSAALDAGDSTTSEASRTGPRSMWLMIESGALVVMLVAPIVLAFMSAHTGYRHRVTTSFTPQVAALIQAIVAETDPSGRLMIEDGPAALYGESHMPGILPVYTGVEQIGGPYPFTFLKHHFATFQADKTFGKTLDGLSPELFWRYIDLYNVRWIVTASAPTRNFVMDAAAQTGVQPAGWGKVGSRIADVVWTNSNYTLWRVNRPAPDDGRTHADFNRLEVAVRPEEGPVLLRYHWDPGMKPAPPATLSPVHVLGDPVPFTMVDPNGLSLVIIKH